MTRRTLRLTLPLAILVAVAGLTRLSAPASAQDTATLIIPGTGDSQELLTDLAIRFMRENPTVKIEIPDSIGTSGGIKAVLAGKAEIARTARPLREEEKAAGLAETVFAKTPVVFAVNPSVTGVTGLTKAQALDVFSGALKDWSQLGGAPGPIARVCRETPETSRVLIDAAIPGFAATGCQDQAVAYSTPEAVKMVAEHPGAIGYFSWAAARDTGLKPLALDGVLPTAENMAAGRYPLLIPFALAYKPPLTPTAARFVAMLGTPEVARRLQNAGCLPLPVNAAAP